MILVRKENTLMNSNIMDLLMVDRTQLKDLLNALKEKQGPRKLIFRASKAPMVA